jgi:hypothetical protein
MDRHNARVIMTVDVLVFLGAVAAFVLVFRPSLHF